ncbi:hypothetical protein GCM10008018_36950 [Paenibacillus marchantiophytorum]|uniref:ribonuclease H n=1 Tax=Paenibacillus marchantiophytorum TaxID=1619310 RepID=A0ABQ1EUT9_9BACL|nr:ribonuclease H family protein [Paenibacillus marchantiophytorum]GFZ87322.1 hypothetical protein GCM10008018_36950 [Paenibacillus marchantiophytorum]
MSTKKYYSVKKGRLTGIFETWDKCKAQIDGYSGAEYKSFASLIDAKKYLKEDDNLLIVPTDLNNQDNDLKRNVIVAYVDGSYSENLKIFSYACVFLDGKETTISGTGNNKDNISMRNVAGELLGAMEAIKWAIKEKYEEIIIHYDYEGIEKWANGLWKANKEGTQYYKNFIIENRNIIKISFKKVKAHSGDKYNEIVDSLAKNAIENAESIKSDRELTQSDPVDLALFNKIMYKKEKAKNLILFKVSNYEITESKLKKLAKELWVKSGKDVTQINTSKVSFNLDEMKIHCELIDKSGEVSNFYLSIL